MPERDECRDVALPSGETLRVLARGGLGPAGVAALGELVDVARRLQAREHPPEPGSEALYARVAAAREQAGLSAYQAAKRARVRFSVLVRLARGRMPGAGDLAAIEAWLEAHGG